LNNAAKSAISDQYIDDSSTALAGHFIL